MLDLRSQRLLLTGGSGFLGRAVRRALDARGVPADSILSPRSADCDLRDQAATRRLVRESFAGRGPTLILHLANFTGGLAANRRWPARFFHDSLAMPLNLVEACRDAGLLAAAKIVQVGTMCSYPEGGEVPYKEDSLWRGKPDHDIAPYGLGKLAALALLDAYRREHGLRSAYAIPTGFFGPGDNMDPANSHVCGAFVRKYVDAAKANQPEVINWGTGAPRRDFIYIDDAAEGLLLAAEHVDTPDPINLTGGVEVSIRELAETISRLVGYTGRTVWDAAKGDGQARRSLDGTRAREVLGFTARTTLEEGLRRTVEWYRA